MSTIEIPEDLAARLDAEAKSRGVTPDQLAADALRALFGRPKRTLSFAAIGASGSDRGGAEAEELLEEGFGTDSADAPR